MSVLYFPHSMELTEGKAFMALQSCSQYSYPEIVTVTDDGLLTCTGEAGWGKVSATDGEHTMFCEVQVVDESYGYDVYPETEIANILIPGKDGKNVDDYFSIELAGGETEEVSLLNDISRYVYYSGDAVIPESLQYQNRDLKVTQLGDDALAWCEEMERVTI